MNVIHQVAVLLNNQPLPTANKNGPLKEADIKFTCYPQCSKIVLPHVLVLINANVHQQVISMCYACNMQGRI